MLISIIIPTYNRTLDLKLCLGTLMPQVAFNDSIELIVSDDGRDAASREMVQLHFPTVRWLKGPQRGAAANRNHATRIASGIWLIFIDDDCIPQPDFMESYHREIGSIPTSERVALQGPTLRSSERPSLLWEAPHNPEGVDCISANFAIRRDDFNAVGMFDEHFTVAFEDIEFFARFRSSGGNIRFVSNAVVLHPLRKVPGAGKLANRWEGKAILSMYYGASSWTILWRLPWHALRVIQSRFRGQQMNAENRRAAWLFFKEWLIVARKTPWWVWKWSRAPRNNFWKAEIAKSGPPAKFGF